jgi:two-component system NarL family response regulator
MENQTIRPTDLSLVKMLGLSNKEIAKRLGTSPKTINKRASRLLERLEVSNRTGAVVVAMKHGLIKLDDVEY